jgi:hypothetical protein
MMEQFSYQAHRSLFDRRCATAIGARQERLNVTQDNVANLIDAASENLVDLGTSAKRRWEAMKARHQSELNRHYQKKPVQELPAKFRRRSSQLLEKLRQERRLFFQSRFEEAQMLRRECDQIDQIESAAQFDAALAHWQTHLRHMENRHRKEEMAMRDWIAERKQEYDTDTQNQCEAMTKRKEHLTTEIRGIEAYARAASKHAIRRKIHFVRAKSRGQIETTPVREEIQKLCANLPDRAKQELLRPIQ